MLITHYSRGKEVNPIAEIIVISVYISVGMLGDTKCTLYVKYILHNTGCLKTVLSSKFNSFNKK